MMVRRNGKAFSVLWGILSGVAFAPPAMAADVNEQIAELEQQYDKLKSLHTEANLTIRNPSGERKKLVSAWERFDEGKVLLRRTVRSFAEDGSKLGEDTLTVKDGTTAWREMSAGSKTLVFKSVAKEKTDYQTIKDLLARGEGRMGDGGAVLEQPCVLLDIHEKGSPEKKIASYWISRRYGIVLKSLVQSADGTVTELVMKEFEVDKEMPDSFFYYKPPGGAQVIDQTKAAIRKSD